jgi:hypothetical protein
MYAGTTIRHGSGRLVGVHQKIDRVARRNLKKLIKKTDYFPHIKDILYFEGNNGPDGLKRKNPAIDKTWYFIDPSKPDDRSLIVIINDHIFNLSVALKKCDNVRAAFEASWLAHAIVDGLTPAHHYPLGDKIEELWGKSHNELLTLWEKNIIPGVNLRDTLSKNWEYWGAGGVFTTHGMFELGVASAIAADNYRNMSFSRKDIIKIKRQKFDDLYADALYRIDSMKMYEELGKYGWTQRLAKQTKEVLVPEMVRMVVFAWYKSLIMSETSN